MSKEIIRTSDLVKIIKPKIFVRCGYPMDVQEVAESLFRNKKFREETFQLLYKQGIFNTDDATTEVFQEICNRVAYAKCKAKKWGGKERTVHTKTKSAINGKWARVKSIKYVKSGIYTPGSLASYGFEYDCDYDPPYLSNQKTHKILEVQICEENTTFWIEADNVQKTKSIDFPH